MSNQNIQVTQNSSGGIGFLGALTLLFIALKLTEVIDWSWWWVLSPMWIPIVTIAGAVALVFLVWGLSWPVRKAFGK